MAVSMARLLLLAALVAPTVAIKTSALSKDLDMSLKSRPVMKVIGMLEDMNAELNKEMEDDKAVYEMMTCWCKTNEKEKTASIEAGQANIEQLTASMGESAAKIAELKAKRKANQEEMYADQKALGEATAQRMEENKEFHKEETDYLGAISAAKGAIVALSKHNPQLVQVKSAMSAFEKAGVAHMISTSRRLSRGDVKALKEFMHNTQGASSFLSIPGMQSYAPQSGQIFGILGQMKEDFEADLSDSQKAEADSVEKFEMLRAAKQDEIATAQELQTKLDGDIAEFGEKFATATKEKEDAEAQLADDQEFLANLQAKCASIDADFEARMKSRLTEISAVGDTIAFLNSPEAYSVFDKSVNSFLQTSSSNQEKEMQARRHSAASLLQQLAAKTGSPQMALIATKVQLDAFTEVKAEIDKMVTEMKKQNADEIEFRDQCISDINENTRDETKAYDKKDSLTAKMADLAKSIESLTANIKTSTETVAETKKQMKRASETREAENGDFQQIIVDQRVTQAILTKALNRMKEVYALMQAPGAPHTQTSATRTDPGNGPAKFANNSEKNAGGAKVVAMIQEVIDDSVKQENEALFSETDAQAAYEMFMKDSNKSLTQLAKSITNMSESLAKAKEDASMAKSDFGSTMKTLEGLNTLKADLHNSCDFTLKNFDARQEARTAEINALGEAKNILSGM